METVHATEQKLKGLQKFKSYYVVWKLDKETGKIIIVKAFKSYYVVWKPKE